MNQDLKETAKDALEHLLNEDQDETQVRKVHDKVADILTAGEEIQYIAVQKHPFGLNLISESVVLTTKRFILHKPTLLGGASFTDHLWRELKNVQVRETLTGATLKMQTVSGTTLTVNYLPKAQARKLYRYAQEMEEKVAEIRREREMEEARAAAGGVTMQVPGGSGTQRESQTADSGDDVLNQLEKLAVLKEKGILTEEEFAAKKKQLLGI